MKKIREVGIYNSKKATLIKRTVFKEPITVRDGETLRLKYRMGGIVPYIIQTGIRRRFRKLCFPLTVAKEDKRHERAFKKIFGDLFSRQTKKRRNNHVNKI